jgi:hypothetical protein
MMIAFRSSTTVVALMALTACAPVPVGTESKAFSDAVRTATTPMEAELQARTEAEEAAAQSAAIAAGAEVYDIPDTCISAASMTPDTAFSDCSLVPLNTAPVAPGSAKAMLAYVRTLRTYAVTLDALATSDAPQAVGSSFGEFLGALSGLAAVRPEFADLKQTVNKTKAPLTSLAGQLAEAQRTRLIRTLVKDAGPGLDEIIDRLIAYRDPDDGLSDATDSLRLAYDRMEDARRSGNRNAYTSAVRGYEGAFAVLQSRMRSSDAGRLALIRDAQTALRERLAKPGDLESYVKLIETIKSLSDALQS